MKYFLSFIICFFIYSNLYSQEVLENRNTLTTNKIIGNWGFDFMDYEDGSRIMDNNTQHNTASMLIFRKSSFLSVIYHAQAVSTSYRIDDNLLSIDRVTYKIEKLTPQELVFTEYNPAEKKESYETKRYHYLFTKESSEQFYDRKFVKPNLRIKANGDTTYAFCEDFYPYFIPKQYGQKIKLTNFHDVFEASYQTIDRKFDFPQDKKGRFSITFEISKEGKIINPFVKESSDATYDNQLLAALNATEGSWKVAEYRFKPVAVQFNYIFEYETKTKEKEEQFDPESYDYYLEKADNLFANKNYEKAVKFYTKCILMTDDAIEPLYKRANCYFTVNALKNACLDWNYLVGKGQKRAEKLYLKHCMK